MQKTLIQYGVGYILLAIINPFSFIDTTSYFGGLLSFIVVNTIVALGLHFLFNFLKGIERWLQESFSFLFSFLISSTLLWFLWEASGIRLYLTFVSSFILVAAIVLLFRFVIYHGQSLKSSVNSNTSFTEETTVDKLQIFASNDKIILEVEPKDLIFVESNDNYVIIYYVENEIVQKIMERLSLKKIEEQLSSYSSFLRVHKSYIVNRASIEKVNGKSQAYRLKLYQVENEIPVSRTFNLTDLEK